MEPLSPGVFNVFALSLPKGYAFGDGPPSEGWHSEDGRACAVLTRQDKTGQIGFLVMRRREDAVWKVTARQSGFTDVEQVRALTWSELKEDAPLEAIPPGVSRRPGLFDLQGREPSEMFRLLSTSSHRNGAWIFNQVYLALPRPDRNWARDCQGENFHTRLWEAQLLASFREQGLLVEQPHEAPDFRIENRRGGIAWVEAVTANPRERYEHVNARPTVQPADDKELFFGAAALRFAKTIGSKLQRRYDQLPHVQRQPFALALADFHAPGSMVWSREALISYLYGFGASAIAEVGRRVALKMEASHLLGETGFPAGLFTDARHEELSAVIFSNACTVSKLNRMAIMAGASGGELKYVRYGRLFDRRPGVLEGIPFCLDVSGDEYRRMWPEGGEPWSAELEVFHNPFARYPLTWPRNASQLPIFYNHLSTMSPQLAGRRYWDQPSTPLYPFGYGLSYTTFEYSAPNIDRQTVGVGETVRVTASLKNVGKVSGEEVAQLYIHQQYGSASRPVRELKGFQRVSLEPGETKTVTFTLSADELTYWSSAKKAWVLEASKFDVWIGGNSDTKNRAEFEVVGDDKLFHP